MLLDEAQVRPLTRADYATVVALLDRDPVTNVFVAARVHASAMDPARLGGELWGYHERGRLVSACFAGANLVPVQATPPAVAAFAARAARQGRRCSSVVGPADVVGALWALLEPHWGPAREVRARQPVLVLEGGPRVPPDPQVRRVRPEELDVLLPAAVAMFTEEVGVSPVGDDGGAAYRKRLAELVRQGRAFARFEDGRVLFKAEVGAVSPRACQVQGVWVPPERRGRSLSVAGMAAVAQMAGRDFAPLVSLYVNDFNVPARAAYRRVGFREAGTLATVLF